MRTNQARSHEKDIENGDFVSCWLIAIIVFYKLAELSGW